ncbi:MAG: hypothetical protein OEY49_18355, partial [Candidatus Heimdallarchaeota archaeon]|nr:hypothetical protein [Candidatus Heimdallarchaeota archaeon]
LSERGNMKKKLAAIVNQLSDENTRLNVNGIRETINYLMFTKLKDLRICDELNENVPFDQAVFILGLITIVIIKQRKRILN